MFELSKWIWNCKEIQKDSYADFYAEFEFEKNAYLNISCDSNYACYIEGKLVAFGQYADFPAYKVYDRVDISEFCKKGTNRIDITVWYYGIETSSVYCKGNPCLIFEITDTSGNILAKSDDGTMSRVNPYFKSGYEKIITPQLGYSFLYDAGKSETEYSKSILVNQNLPLYQRPNKKLKLCDIQVGKLIKKLPDNSLLYDTGCENVGFIYLEVFGKCGQKITVSYGEHITDGRVRRKIDMRDFSVEFILKEGKNILFNPFRRLGCRYLEVSSEGGIEIGKIGIIPTEYPVSLKKSPSLSAVQKKIYDICVNTLKLCMHEHYEDCPWREQALYTMDSRNQMLCGYYAFEGYEFARSNLVLISKDNRKDGLLSICYPKGDGKVIPSFSLHYVTEVLEYYRYSKDKSLLEEVFPKIQSVLKVFTDRLENYLILPFDSPYAWNFYEWVKGLDGKETDYTKKDLILNCLLSKALKEADEIGKILSVETDYLSYHLEINKRINEVFYCKEKGIYLDFEQGKSASELGNALAVLCSASEGKDICEKLVSGSLTPCSLSMLCFKYDALIKADRQKYKDYILKDIETIFRPMAEYGNGTVWETVLGESDFKNAGSLCHGWSAMPVYYYNILGE